MKRDIEYIKEAITEVKSDVKESRADISEIKVDLKYHIKRTDLLEDIIKPIHKTWIFAKYSAFLITLLCSILGVLAAIFLT